MIRLINNHGNIFEGCFNNHKMNGFCVSYLGNKGEIDIGTYSNNHRNGNWIKLEGETMKIIESGFYENGVLIKEIDKNRNILDTKNIFLDSSIIEIMKVTYSDLPKNEKFCTVF